MHACFLYSYSAEPQYNPSFDDTTQTCQTVQTSYISSQVQVQRITHYAYIYTMVAYVIVIKNILHVHACMCLTLVYNACMHIHIQYKQLRFQQSLPQQANPFASPVKRAIFGRPTNRKLCFVHTNNDGWCSCI